MTNLTKNVKRKQHLENRGVEGQELEEGLERESAYKFFVPHRTRWENIKHLKQEVGAELMKVFANLEAKNIGNLEQHTLASLINELSILALCLNSTVIISGTALLSYSSITAALKTQKT